MPKPQEPADDTSESKSNGPYSMTTEILTQKSETVELGRFRTQLYAGTVASISSVSFGTVVGWSSPMIRQIMDGSVDHITTHVQLTLLASLGPLGCAIGIIAWSYFNIKFGPRKSMLIQAPLLFLTWLTLAFIKNANISLALRFFCGFFAVANRICSETLLLDSVNKYFLPYMIIPYKLCVIFGVLISYVLGYTISDANFSLCNCLIVLIHFILLYVSPESPVYLYEINIKKAEAALSWYRGRENIFMDMRTIKKYSDLRKVDPGAYRYMLYSKVVMKAILIVLGLNIAQVFSGYYIFLYYNVAIVRKYSDLNVTDLTSGMVTKDSDVISRNVDSFIVGLTMFVSGIFSAWMHYRNVIGVKKPLLISCSLVALNLIFIGGYFFLREKEKTYGNYDTWYVVHIHNKKWIYLVLVCSLIIFHEIGLSSCPDIILLEYIPREVYPRAKVIVKFCQWMLIFFIVKAYFGIQYYVTGWGLMLLQALILIVAFILICFFCIESKGKSLMQIQRALGGNPVGTRTVSARSEHAQPMDLNFE